MSDVDRNVGGHVTTEATVSSAGPRTAKLLAVEERKIEHREVSDVLMLGAPVMFIVLAVSAMCCIIIIRWKIQDRLRRRRYDNRSRDTTAHSPQRRPTTEGTIGIMIIAECIDGQ